MESDPGLRSNIPLLLRATAGRIINGRLGWIIRGCRCPVYEYLKDSTATATAA